MHNEESNGDLYSHGNQHTTKRNDKENSNFADWADSTSSCAARFPFLTSELMRKIYTDHFSDSLGGID